MAKRKLTLALDGAVINKAKSAGINISVVTEALLIAMTSSSKRYDEIISAFKVYEKAVANLRETMI